MSDLEREFLTRFIQLAPDYPQPVSEYQFYSERKWRFDFAFVPQKVAVEMEGGVFSGGRHTRGRGYTEDVIKYNQAVVMGWKVLRFTGLMIQADPETCIEQVKRLLEGRQE